MRVCAEKVPQEKQEHRSNESMTWRKKQQENEMGGRDAMKWVKEQYMQRRGDMGSTGHNVQLLQMKC